MRKVAIVILILFASLLWGCSTQKETFVQKINLNGGRFYENERDLFLPVPYKNNHVFLGWSLSDKDQEAGMNAILEPFGTTMMMSISPETFKQYSENTLVVFYPKWIKMDEEAFFTYTYLRSKDAYEVAFNKSHEVYPREITIPDTYQGKQVVRIADEGFADCEDLLIVHLGKYIQEIGNNAFKNTSLFQINTHKKMNISKTAFNESLMGHKVTPIKGIAKKRITIGFNNYYISTSMKEESFIEEEFFMFLPIPLNENKVFLGWKQNGDFVSLPSYTLDQGISGSLISLKNVIEKKDIPLVAEYRDFEVSEFELVNYALLGGPSLSLHQTSYPREINLQTFEFGSSIKAIKDFKEAREVAVVTLPETITTIAKEAFRETKLYQIVLRNSITTIEEYAFADTFLSATSLPQELTKLDQYAFYNTMVKRVEIPNSLQNISPTAFLKTRDLEFVVSNIHPQYSINPEAGNKMLFSKDEKTLLFASQRSDVTIIQGVEVIGEHVFSESTFHRIHLPNSIKTIHSFAFFNATVHQGISIPSNLVEIKDYAFYGYQSNQKQMKFSNKLQSVGEYAFAHSSVYSFVFEDGLTDIKQYAFYQLKTPWMNEESSEVVMDASIVIPSSVTTIGQYALNWFDKITFEGYVDVKNEMFEERSRLKEFNSPRTIWLKEEFFGEMKASIARLSQDQNIMYEVSED